MKILSKEQDTDVVKEFRIDPGSQLEVKYDKDSNCILTIKGLVVPPLTEVVISFGIRKILIPFEEYPNDPNRGFNIPQMPVYYVIGRNSK